jgi:hypothetical protein
MSNGKPRPGFYAAVLLVVIGLVGLGLWRFGALDSVISGSGGDISPSDLPGGGAEAADADGITTVKEYSYVAAQRLPEVTGVSNY